MTLSKRGGWSPRRCHASCPAAKRAPLAARSLAAGPLRGGDYIPRVVHGLSGPLCVRWPASGPMRWTTPDDVPGQLAPGHAAAHHFQQPDSGAAPSCPQLPLGPGVSGLQQQLSHRDLRVHVWELTQAGLSWPVLQHVHSHRRQDLWTSGQPGHAQDDGQPRAFAHSSRRFCRKRSTSSARCESEQHDGTQHHVVDRAASSSLCGPQWEPLELRVRQRRPVPVGPFERLQISRFNHFSLCSLK